jgi:hypothetical protein
MELELRIFNYDDASLQLAKLDVDIRLKDLEVNPITFYSIDAISPYDEDGVEYSIVFSSGREFVCDLDYKSLIEVIRIAKLN